VCVCVCVCVCVHVCVCVCVRVSAFGEDNFIFKDTQLPHFGDTKPCQRFFSLQYHCSLLIAARFLNKVSDRHGQQDRNETRAERERRHPDGVGMKMIERMSTALFNFGVLDEHACKEFYGLQNVHTHSF